MRDIDRMPKQWRVLVYEYGYQLVCAVRDGELSIKQARDQLSFVRSARQAQWLATDYVTKKTARNYF